MAPAQPRPPGDREGGVRIDVPHVPGELLLTLAQPPSDPALLLAFEKERAELLESLGASIVRSYPQINGALVRFATRIDGEKLEQARRKMEEARKYFRSVGLNQLVFPAQPPPPMPGPTPDDPYLERQWSLDRIHIRSAWSATTGKREVLAALVDSGVALMHPDLEQSLWVNPCELAANGLDEGCAKACGNTYPDDVHGWNFLDRNGNPADDYGHGSQVAGIIGAVTDNQEGIAGISWKISLLPLKFYSAKVQGKLSDAIEAILYAASIPVDVINASWAVYSAEILLKEAVAFAGRQNVVVVAAAGRGDYTGIDLDLEHHQNYPCSFHLDNVICVTATDEQDKLGSLSSWGSTTVDLGAPGEKVISTTSDPNYLYAYGHGSSMAAPHVAGVVALLRAQCPSWTPFEVRKAIRTSVEKLSALSNTISGGLLDATYVVPSDPASCFPPPVPPPTLPQIIPP